MPSSNTASKGRTIRSSYAFRNTCPCPQKALSHATRGRGFITSSPLLRGFFHGNAGVGALGQQFFLHRRRAAFGELEDDAVQPAVRVLIFQRENVNSF